MNGKSRDQESRDIPFCDFEEDIPPDAGILWIPEGLDCLCTVSPPDYIIGPPIRRTASLQRNASFESNKARRSVECNQTPDNFTQFGTYVANKLRDLDYAQNKFAEKLISDVLFEADMGTLNRSWKLTEDTGQCTSVDPTSYSERYKRGIVGYVSAPNPGEFRTNQDYVYASEDTGQFSRIKPRSYSKPPKREFIRATSSTPNPGEFQIVHPSEESLLLTQINTKSHSERYSKRFIGSIPSTSNAEEFQPGQDNVNVSEDTDKLLQINTESHSEQQKKFTDSKPNTGELQTGPKNINTSEDSEQFIQIITEPPSERYNRRIIGSRPSTPNADEVRLGQDNFNGSEDTERFTQINTESLSELQKRFIDFTLSNLKPDESQTGHEHAPASEDNGQVTRMKTGSRSSKKKNRRNNGSIPSSPNTAEIQSIEEHRIQSGHVAEDIGQFYRASPESYSERHERGNFGSTLTPDLDEFRTGQDNFNGSEDTERFTQINTESLSGLQKIFIDFILSNLKPDESQTGQEHAPASEDNGQVTRMKTGSRSSKKKNRRNNGSIPSSPNTAEIQSIEEHRIQSGHVAEDIGQFYRASPESYSERHERGNFGSTLTPDLDEFRTGQDNFNGSEDTERFTQINTESLSGLQKIFIDFILSNLKPDESQTGQEHAPASEDNGQVTRMKTGSRSSKKKNRRNNGSIPSSPNTAEIQSIEEHRIQSGHVAEDIGQFTRTNTESLSERHERGNFGSTSTPNPGEFRTGQEHVIASEDIAKFTRTNTESLSERHERDNFGSTSTPNPGEFRTGHEDVIASEDIGQFTRTNPESLSERNETGNLGSTSNPVEFQTGQEYVHASEDIGQFTRTNTESHPERQKSFIDFTSLNPNPDELQTDLKNIHTSEETGKFTRIKTRSHSKRRKIGNNGSISLTQNPGEFQIGQENAAENNDQLNRTKPESHSERRKSNPNPGEFKTDQEDVHASEDPGQAYRIRTGSHSKRQKRGNNGTMPSSSNPVEPRTDEEHIHKSEDIRKFTLIKTGSKRKKRENIICIPATSSLELLAEIMAQNSKDQVPTVETELMPCRVCGRTFVPDRIEYHERVCKSARKEPRTPYDSVSHRWMGTDNEPAIKWIKSNPEDKPPREPRASSRDRNEMPFPKPAEPCEEPIAAVVKPDGRIECPSCKRSFEETAASRHIPGCTARAKGRNSR